MHGVRSMKARELQWVTAGQLTAGGGQDEKEAHDDGSPVSVEALALSCAGGGDVSTACQGSAEAGRASSQLASRQQPRVWPGREGSSGGGDVSKKGGPKGQGPCHKRRFSVSSGNHPQDAGGGGGQLTTGGG